MTAALAALAAAACFAVATALQHRGAAVHPTSSGLGLRLLWTLLRSPAWLAGLLLASAGLALHAYALAHGRLLVVQPLLVTGLLFTLLVAAALERRRPRRPDVVWGGCIAVGLVVFLASAQPAPGSVLAPSGALAAAVLTAVALAGSCVVTGRFLPRHAAVLLATGAGCCFGVTAALLKQLTGLTATSWLAVLAHWPLYALIAVGLVGISLAQSAYQAGPLASSVPALSVVEPLVAGVIGALSFGESPSSLPLHVVGQTVGVALMCLGVLRSSAAAPSLPPALDVRHEQGDLLV